MFKQAGKYTPRALSGGSVVEEARGLQLKGMMVWK